jgi:multiple sugar transport system permease protein
MANMEANEEMFKILKPENKNVAAALRMHIDVAEVARIRPVTFVGQILWNEHVRAVDQAGLGIVSPKAALEEGARRVQMELDAEYNKEKFGIVDLNLMNSLIIGAIIALIIGWFIWIKRHKMGALERQETKWGYIFLSPWLIGFFVFTIGPMIASLFFSFTQYNVLTPPRFVGLMNYQELYTVDSERITKAFGNVMYLAGIGVPLGIITGIAVAMLLNTGVKGLRAYRTVYYLPAIVPGMASTILWLYILSADPNRGLIASFWLQHLTPAFGVQPPGWTSVESWAKPALIVMGLWGAGSGMIFWLAALKGISGTLYEAAGIDGATPWQQFRSITLPMLGSYIFFSMIMGFIGAMNTFDQVYIISNGQGAGPNDTMLTPVYYLFNQGFTFFRMGYASALAWLIFAVILVVSLIQLKVGKKVVYSEVSK